MTTKRIPDRAGPVRSVTKCRWCQKPKPWPDRYRRTFCSDECVEQHKIRTQPDHAAKRVLERDHGICCGCGTDTIALRQELDRRLHAAMASRFRMPIECHLPMRWGETCEHAECIDYRVRDAILHSRRQYHEAIRDADFVAWCTDRPVPIPPHLRTGKRRLWEMDHILPVVEGGADCGLENLRTLCWACHRTETAALAARRAADRRK